MGPGPAAHRSAGGSQVCRGPRRALCGAAWMLSTECNLGREPLITQGCVHPRFLVTEIQNPHICESVDANGPLAARRLLEKSV